MLPFLSGIAIPGLAFVLMLMVGLDLRIEDFRRVSRYPRTVLIATTGQVLLLPLLAVGLVHVATPSETLSSSMIFLAVSPGGAIANYSRCRLR
jgi:BASS family bile acid:Na+ symporter